MGIYVNLDILPTQINPQDWRKTYEDTVVFLQDPAIEAMGIQTEEIYATERRVFSRRIEHAVENPSERFWNVLGDFKSKERAESFILHYDLSHYMANTAVGSRENVSDIIPAVIAGKGRRIFADKTQGYSYHIPILAVAMMVEDRFPQYAMAGGDIDIEQAKEAQTLIKRVLGRDVMLPVVVDQQRLYHQLLKYFPAEEAVKNMDHLFRDDTNLFYQAVFKPTPTLDPMMTGTSSGRLDQMVKAVANWFLEARAHFAERFSGILDESIENLKINIVKRADSQSLIFTEDAWGWIDKEHRQELLGFVLLLVSIKNDALAFNDLRRLMLENRDYCVRVLAEYAKLK